MISNVRNHFDHDVVFVCSCLNPVIIRGVTVGKGTE